LCPKNVTKYDSSGNKQWTKLLGTTAGDQGYGIAMDPAGNAHITGYPMGNLDGQTSAGKADVFVAKIAPDGTWW